MRPNISNKLRVIATAIDRRGSANLTRLTVLKKWFEVSSHLSSFAIFIADQASRQKTKTTKEAAELFREARTLLADVDVFAPEIPRVVAKKLHVRLRAFQNEYKNSQWGAVRIIHDHNLFLIECGLHIYLGMEIRRLRGIVSPRVTANTTIHATETASMVLAAEG